MTCKHNWHFVDGLTKRIRCTRCAEMQFAYKSEEYDLTKLTIPNAQLKFHDPRPNNIIFYNTAGGEQVEVLRISPLGITANPDIPTDEAADAVLRALDGHIKGLVQKATAEALAQTEQEPVAWFSTLPDGRLSIKIVGKPTEGNWEPLYIAPPQRTWVGLTPQERDEINEQVYGAVPHHVAFHHAIEAKLKEKNT